MTRLPLLAATLILAPLAAQAEEKRSADAHEHGHGAFNMAIEDDHAEIELEVPAHDILGFEHAPSTPGQRAAVSDAMATLSRPATLFALPDEAGCVAGRIEIAFGAIAGEEDHDDHDHGEDHDHEKEGHEDHAEEGEGHSEVTARYHFACENPQAITSIEFGFFDAFPNAEELEIAILSEAGQSAGEATPDDRTFAID